MTETPVRAERTSTVALPFPLALREGRAHLCVVVPVYNEARALELLVPRLRAALDPLDVSWSLLVVNDASSDDTLAVLEGLAARDSRVGYLSLSRNFGHQAALSAGLDNVDADLVVTMDGDLQHPPELIEALIAAWRSGYDVVHTRKLATEGLSLPRRLATKLAYAAIQRIADVEIIPDASDFRLLDRSVLRALQALPERQRLYRGLTPWIGFRQTVVPYRAAARMHGESRYGLRRLLQLFARSFFDFSNAPLHVGLAVGGATVLGCIAYALYTLVVYLLGHDLPRGYVTLIFAIVLLSSINLMFTGVLGVYLARIYDEVRRRPSYVVGRRSATDFESERGDEHEHVHPL